MSVISVRQLGLLNELYNSHHGWLHSWLRKKLGSSHAADDFTQDTFMKLFSIPDIASINTPRAYLATTAKRLMIDAARRQTLENAYLEAIVLFHEDTYVSSPEEHQQAVETLMAIMQMLDGMPDKMRRAFLIKRLDNLSNLEIALQLGVSERMVKKYLATAMAHCYKTFSEYLSDR